MAMGDLMGMMKQAAELQAKMQELQAELERLEVEGTAGGGLYTVPLSAKGHLLGVKLDDSLITPTYK
jgi:DNA-binding protein YbaB